MIPASTHREFREGYAVIVGRSPYTIRHIHAAWLYDANLPELQALA
jgi:hypothetical protein